MSKHQANIEQDQRRFDIASTFVDGRIQPLFKMDASGEPYFAGTAFCLDVKGSPYMITAAHVLERDEDNRYDADGQIFCISWNDLKQLSSFKKTLINVEQDGRGDSLDLVAIEPNSFPMESIFQDNFKESDLFSKKLGEEHYAAMIGYPGSKNKRKYNSTELTNKPYAYLGKITEARRLIQAGFEPPIYFGVDFDIKRAFSPDGTKRSAPKPHGISGGPVFIVGDFNALDSNESPKLVGVAIQYRKKEQCLVAIHIATLIRALDERIKPYSSGAKI